MVARLYISLLPEAGGEAAVLHAQDTALGINLGSPPPAMVCRIAKTSALTKSILKKEPHALHFFKICLDLAPDLIIHTRA